MSQREGSNPWRTSGFILLFIMACVPSQVSHMRLDMSVGYSVVYRITFWNQEKPGTTKVRMAVHVTELTDLDYSLTANIKGDQEGTIFLLVSPGGKTMEAEVHGLPDPWEDVASAGIVSPCAPLPQEPVSPGQSWEVSLANGRGTYTYKGTGLLDGKQGYILEFNLSTTVIKDIRATGRISVSPDNGVVQAGAGTITTAFGTYGYRMIRE
ncbi:MAG: hypothetical protein ACP5QG_00210 [candidate division WOR-3 bacterium]